MLDLAEWAASGDWQGAPDTMTAPDQPARDFAISALDRFRRKVKRDGRDLAHIEEEARHEVRKDAKKLRYASEFFTSLFDRKRARRRHKKFRSETRRVGKGWFSTFKSRWTPSHQKQ